MPEETTSTAGEALYRFFDSAIRGMVDHPEKVKVEIHEPSLTSVTIFVVCDPTDLKFVFSRSRALRHIAIAIAKKHRTIFNLIIQE